MGTLKEAVKKPARKVLAVYDGMLIARSRKKVEALHNKYAGKRCFVIGNGPSLTVKDLEALQGEYTITSNLIYKLFDKTEWRPTFYAVQDHMIIKNNARQISQIPSDVVKFLPIWRGKYYPVYFTKGMNRLLLDTNYDYPNPPGFSEDITEVVYEGMTITYTMIQIAVYMGFREIYLIGCDHSFSVEEQPDGTIIRNDGVKDHFGDTDDSGKFLSGTLYMPRMYMTTFAYETAQKYAEEHDIKIFNATRGGKLEAFPRADLDEVLTKSAFNR